MSIPLQRSRASTATEALQACTAASMSRCGRYGPVGLTSNQAARTGGAGDLGLPPRPPRPGGAALRDRDAPCHASETAYGLPYAVTDSATARRLAADVEGGVAAAYADLVQAADGELRASPRDRCRRRQYEPRVEGGNRAVPRYHGALGRDSSPRWMRTASVVVRPAEEEPILDYRNDDNAAGRRLASARAASGLGVTP